MKKNLIPVEIIPSNHDGSFIAKDVPVVIKGGAKSWPAYQKWSPEFFTEQYGQVKVPLSNYKKDPYQLAQTKPDILIAEYLESAQKISRGESDPNEDMYSAGWFFCRGYCELLKDLAIPKYFEDNWADKVQKILHFDTKSILFGHPKVESPLHTDSFFVSTYFAMIRGQKRMRLVHPKHTEHVHNGFDVYNDLKLAELAAKDVDVFDCTIEEGDLVWFPPGWWHYVKNDTFTISITISYVDACHFLPFEQQIRATILKPLLRLAQVKAECLQSASLSFTEDNIINSRYQSLEGKYVAHFRNELEKTQALLGEIEEDLRDRRNRLVSSL